MQYKDKRKIVVSGTGCALADYIYNGISFESEYFMKYASIRSGDGGLEPGKLVFTGDLERFSGKKYTDVIKDITGNRPHDAMNVGGPSIVSMIHASQMLPGDDFEVRFYGMSGNDEVSLFIRRILAQTPLQFENYLMNDERGTPFTIVVSDPTFDSGAGERTFVNHLGAAWNHKVNHLDEDFFSSDIVCFGGTALVPGLHDNLSEILSKAKKSSCINVVTTVFDFRNEKKDPNIPWPFLETEEDYRLIDLLIMDANESLRISGDKDLESAAEFFCKREQGSFIITNGADDIWFASNGGIFSKQQLTCLPVFQGLDEYFWKSGEQSGDTTGCGDNFAGGVISSLAMQLRNSPGGDLDLMKAITFGVASGGFACTYLGGTCLEGSSGEKRASILKIMDLYIEHLKSGAE